MIGLLVACVFAAAPPELDQAKEALRAVQYPRALTLLLQARAARGTELETSCEIDELIGIVQATLRRPRPATESFKRLLSQKPTHAFTVAQSPRVMTPYFEARSWLKDTGALRVAVTGTRREGVLELSWAIERDPLGLVDTLEATLLEDGVPRVVRRRKTEGLTVQSRARRISVSTRALDDGDREVFVEASRVFDAPAAVPERPPAPEPPPLVAAVTSQPAPAAPRARGLTPLRTTALVLGGLAVGGLALGTVFGSQSVQARSEFESALSDSNFFGRSPLSMSEARQLDDRVRSTAWAANGSFIGAGVLALAAVVLWLVGAP